MSDTDQASTLVGPLLQSFFTEHMLSHRRASQQTVDSYRDTFRLLLRFLQQTTGKEPASLRIADLDAPAMLSFLEHVEQQRHNQVQSRNVRLAALRSFFRLVALRDPASIHVVTRVLAIPVKRADKRLVGYLTRDEMDAILGAPDRKTWAGQRDYTLLLTFYNSGARVSELTSLKRCQVQLGATSFLQLHGKGRKERSVPLWPKTARTLKIWLDASPPLPDGPAFPSARGVALSRDGVNYILQDAVRAAAKTCPTLAARRVTPHVLRHTTAMHLLQSGVDITVIALWLGHESPETTHIYVEADLKTKEQALQNVAPAGKGFRRFQPRDALLAFLDTL
ncbi:MAG: tyrosine-type recombinase/integrase [Bryobacterales bacterium]|nr:tyrosine-type recombinase/integrase [Bryobacterales bacterium]